MSRPDVTFFCDIDYDPFLVMQDNNKMYGFTISLYEYEATIPTLWGAVKGSLIEISYVHLTSNFSAEFMGAHPDLISPDNALSFLSDDGGETYNRCHCEFFLQLGSNWKSILHDVVWSNFEIGNLDLWRGEAYSKFFEFLDSKGGFYYEVCDSNKFQELQILIHVLQRWGDAPVHSIGAALFAKKDQIVRQLSAEF